MTTGLRRLKVSALRNLTSVELDGLGDINLFYGANGSGKSSLLESVHLLFSGRSFRHHQTRPLIQEGLPACSVYGEYVDDDGAFRPFGLQKTRDGKTLAKRDGEPLRSLAELAGAVPLVAMHADSFEVVTGGPAQRRQFLDWQLFHVEHGFMPAWRGAQRALSQRNTLIRHGKISGSLLTPWSHEYARYGEQIDKWRRAQVDALRAPLQSAMAELFISGPVDLAMDYRRGWPDQAQLHDALSGNLERELRMGQTLYGPHRADLKLLSGGRPAAEVLSRGQIKLVVAALKVAQVQLLRAAGRSCIVLVDDLGAELDRVHRHRLCGLLESLGQQLFVAAIEPEELLPAWLQCEATQVFHVEHGTMQRLGRAPP